jgi:hypothetical protein
LSQRAKDVIMHIYLWLWLSGCTRFFSNTELVLLAILMIVVTFLGNETYIIASGLHVLRLVKNLMPSWASPMRKRVHALSKCEN